MCLRSPSEAFKKASFISATEGVLPFVTIVKSVIEPLGTGILKALPSILPSNSGNIFIRAFAAPVVVGIIELAAALPLLKSR